MIVKGAKEKLADRCEEMGGNVRTCTWRRKERREKRRKRATACIRPSIH